MMARAPQPLLRRIGFSLVELLVVLIIGAILTMLAVPAWQRHAERGWRMQARAELVSATPAGRMAPTLATILHGVLADAVLAALVIAVYAGSGFDLGGSVVAGVAAGAVGVVFLGVALVAAQLMRTSRGANSLAVWVLIATFVIGGLGNALGRPSIPQSRPATFRGSLKNAERGLDDACGITADELVGAFRQRDRPLGVVA